MGDHSQVVLITGCSSGIGQATASRLAAGGWTVYATARSVDALAGLAASGCRTLPLDVTDEASMRAAVETIEAEHGAIGVLINNAGYSQSGAVESLPVDRVRRQFETNVFGLLRLCQLCLPGMRRQRWGRIVNVGSMGGRLTFPGGGAYHASKYALEALSDALRFEVAGFGVDVILIQPGLIRTGFAEAASRGIAGIAAPEGPYGAFNAAVDRATADAYEKGPLGRWFGGSPDDVARAIERALRRSSAPARVPVTWSARILMGLRSWMSDRAWDRLVAGSFPRPGA